MLSISPGYYTRPKRNGRQPLCIFFGGGGGGGGWGEVNKVHYVLGENGYKSEIQNAIRSLSQRKTERKHFLKREKSVKYDCLNSLIKCLTKRFPIHFQCIKLSCSTAPFKN